MFKIYWIFLFVMVELFSSSSCYPWKQYYKNTYGKNIQKPPKGSSSFNTGYSSPGDFEPFNVAKYQKIFHEKYQEFLEKPPEVEERSGVIFFSDLRNFTELCEQFTMYLDDEKIESEWIPFYCKFRGKILRDDQGKLKVFTLATFMSFYLNLLDAFLRENKGEAKNYIGDGIFAGFMEGDDTYDLCDRAVEAGLAFISITEKIEIGNKSKGWRRLHCGVGTHLGTMSIERRNGRLIHLSGAINKGSRCEGITKVIWEFKGGITNLPLVITSQVYKRLRESRRYFSHSISPHLKGIGLCLLYGWDGREPKKKYSRKTHLSKPMFPREVVSGRKKKYSRMKKKPPRAKTKEELFGDSLQVISLMPNEKVSKLYAPQFPKGSFLPSIHKKQREVKQEREGPPDGSIEDSLQIISLTNAFQKMKIRKFLNMGLLFYE